MRVSNDSRTIKEGEYFVPVVGDRYDGHTFVREALDKGAVGVIEPEDLFYLASEKIKKYSPLVIAVTGSFGKTTVKEVLASVLSSKYKVFKTSGNLNTKLGISVEIVNNLKPSHQVCVFEVGMDKLGEIRESCEIIKPLLGVVTNIKDMHMEKLGNFDNLFKAKYELFESLPKDGTAVVNADDAGSRKAGRKFKGKKVWYGLDPMSDVGPDVLKDVKIALLGKHNFSNSLAAYAVGKVFQLRHRDIIEALQNARPQKGRLSLLATGFITVIDDTYNSGPASALSALDVLKEFQGKRKIAVLGDMLELGDAEIMKHRKVLQEALKVADVVVLVGPRFGRLTRENHFPNSAEAAGFVTRVVKRGDAVLVKGSQGMRMEKVVEALIGNKDKSKRLLVRQDVRWKGQDAK